jgi:hypothetical protein
MRPPLNKFQPLEGESLFSFMQRIAIGNHYEHLGSMLFNIASVIFTVNCTYIRPEQRWAKTVIELIEACDVDIKPMILNKFNQVLFDKNVINQYEQTLYYENYRTKYCPSCLREKFYHRLFWDVKLLTICPKHKMFMNDRCSKCNKFIPLSRLVRNVCKCGNLYSESEFIYKRPSKTTIDVQSQIYSMLLGEGVLTNSPNCISISRKDYFYLFKVFSYMVDKLEITHPKIVDDLEFKGKITFTKSSNLQMISILTTTCHKIITEPSIYLPLLLNYVDTATSKDVRVSKYKIFKDLLLSSKSRRFLNVYKNYLINLKNEYINEREFPAIRVEEKKYLTKLETLKKLNSENTVIDNLCKHGVLKTYITHKNNRKILLIDKKSVEDYIFMKNNSCSLASVCEILGINFSNGLELINNQLLKPIHGPTVDGYINWYFNKYHVRDLNNKIISMCYKTDTSGDCNISIDKAIGILRPYKVKKWALLKAILNKELKMIYHLPHKKENLCGKLYISKEELNKYISLQKIKRINTLGFSTKELLPIFNMGMPKLKRMIKEEKLMVTSVTLNRRTQYFGKNQVLSKVMQKKNLKLFEAENYAFSKLRLDYD